MKAAIIYNHLFSNAVQGIVGMRKDGTWDGLFSSAQLETSRRSLENICLLEFDSGSYGHNNFSHNVVEWIKNYLELHQCCPITVFYYLPKGSDAISLCDERVILNPFRTKIQFEKTFAKFVQDQGWGITQLPRYER